MSQSTGGFDDWQGPALWRASAWTDDTFAMAANTQTDVYYVRGSSFGCEYVEMSCTGQGAHIRLFSAKTNPDTAPFQQADWVILPDMKITVTIPVISNYFFLSAISSTLGACNLRVRTNRVNLGTDRIHYYGYPHTFGVFNTSIPANSSSKFTSPFLLPGPATLWTNGPNAGSTLSLHLETEDRDGALVTYFYDQNPLVGDQTTPIMIPDSYWRVILSNNGGAAQSGSFAITQQGHVT